MRVLDIKRQMQPDDIAVVRDLLRDAERADGHRPMSDHLWLDLVDGGREGFAGLVAWEPGHEHPVAYSQVSRGHESYSIELVVHPHHRYEMNLIGPELLGAALDEVASCGGGHVHWWVFEPTIAHEQVAASVGLHAGRTLHQMRRSLPLSLADARDEVTTRSFVKGQDEDDWLIVNNRAFAHHPEQGGWDIATLTSRLAQPWFDADGFRVHEAEGRLAGFCWTKIHADTEPTLGEIYVIAVDPDFAGRGLGRGLVVAGLNNMSRRGISTAMLYVDAANDAAITMYENLGFRIHRTDRAFVGDVPGRSAPAQ
ncbi:MAG: acetyltransferase MshD [Actinomycetota bacterium]|jgi:mycothiol synthase